MSVTGIRDSIKTALETITGLTAYDNVPESINKLPAAFVLPRSGEYDYDVGNDMAHNFEITLLLQRAGDITESQNDLDAYLDATGTYSIKAAVDAATPGSNFDAIRVTRYKDYGGLEFSGTMYLGCKFDLEIIT